MIYAMSDIHGYMGKYKIMLDKINFSDDDTLYIIGDIIDRGPKGIDILKEVMDKPNIHVLMGNHEHMMMCYVDHIRAYDYGYNDDRMKDLWYQNGGEVTYNDYMNESKEMKEKIMNFIRNLPYDKIINVNGQYFILAHAFPCGKPKEEDKLAMFEYQMTTIWERIDDVYYPRLPDDLIGIVGHTPTPRYDKKMSPFEIKMIRNNIIDIDCGMSTRDTKNRRLACLRLDDLAEFYT